jgi:pyrroline-5-carboxylate reductase
MTTIGFIGAGQMAQALVSGICSADSSIKFEIADPSTASKDAFQQKVSSPVQVRTDNAELFAACDIVFLSIKPQYFDDAVNFNDVQTAVAKAPRSPLVVSIMAGVTLKKIAEVTGLERIVRVMPNTPSLIMEGAAGLAPSPEVTDQELKTVAKLMSSVGCVTTVSEQLLDAVTGLSGSGPAYVFTFIEALIDGGVLNGLSRAVARELAIQTVIGSAKLVQQTGEHPAVLRDRVTSPGGTTIEALKVLEMNDFRGSIIQAVESATRRSRELGAS